MKKLKISVNGKSYIVDVEILEDDENMGAMPNTAQNYQPAYVAPVEQVQRPAAPKKPIPMAGAYVGLEAPMNGVVIEIFVKPGDSVVVGQLCVALEVMKMKTNVNSPINGVIKSIEAKIGEQVELGQALLTFE